MPEPLAPLQPPGYQRVVVREARRLEGGEEPFQSLWCSMQSDTKVWVDTGLWERNTFVEKPLIVSKALLHKHIRDLKVIRWQKARGSFLSKCLL